MFNKENKIKVGSIVFYKGSPRVVNLISDDGELCFIDTERSYSEKYILEGKIVNIKDLKLIKS